MNFQQLVKYFLEGLGVSLATYLVRGQTASLNEIVTIGLAAAATFFILDLFAPSIAFGSRQGSGYGVGLQTVGYAGAGGIEGFAQQNGGTVQNFDPSLVPDIPDQYGAGEGEEGNEGEEGEGVVYASKNHYNQNCTCLYPCKQTCQPEDKCKVECPPQPPCFREGCDIRGTNCPYKIIPGYYSHRVLLPGYNECVQPYNSEYINQV